MTSEAVQDALFALLERSREAAVESAARTGLPLTEQAKVFAVHFPDPGRDGGWEMGYETVTRSSMANPELSTLILDGVSETTQSERMAVAEALFSQFGQEVFLGAPWEGEQFRSNPTQWIENSLLRSVVSRFLCGLDRLAEPDSPHSSRLVEDIVAFLYTHRIRVIASAVVAGFVASGPVAVENARLRPLSPFEIGAVIAPFTAHMPHNDLNAVQLPLSFWVPRHVLEVEVEAEMEDLRVGLSGAGLRELVLALQLLGFDPRGVGAYREAPVLPWLFGVRGAPLMVGSDTTEARPITAVHLQEAINLAKAFPQGVVDPPRSTETFALHRFALGCSRSSAVDSVVDFVVSMEAALLGGEQGEPTFRFAANGAAFIRRPGPHRRAAYDHLRMLYDLRSRAVHGRKFPAAGELQGASADARAIASEILIRALHEGWPTREVLVQSLMGE